MSNPLTALFSFLSNLFRRPARLPHPEEKMNPEQTVYNLERSTVVKKWLNGWEVPKESWNFWLYHISIQIWDKWPDDLLNGTVKPDTPAFTFLAEADSPIHFIYCLASWCNPGVLAHETAHVSYFILSDEDRDAFETAHNAIKDSDPLIRLLYSINPYGLTSTVEAHAEVYRYLGEKMPEGLKKYYPMLF